MPTVTVERVGRASEVTAMIAAESIESVLSPENPIRAIIRRSPRVVMSDEMVAHLEEIERNSIRIPHAEAMARLGRPINQ